jgi:serine/threonine protein kinase
MSLSPHPDDRTLRDYGLGRLEADAGSWVDTHLGQCDDCRRKVGELSPDSFLGRIQQGQPRTQVASAPRPMAGSVSMVEGTMSYMPGQAEVAPPPDLEKMPPGLVNHPDYEIIGELGRGGMGVVYLAHNTILGRNEVLKVMGRQIVERPGVLERFQREIRAVAGLRHPNIVAAYSAFRIDGGLVLAMEYVEGLDLSRLVKAKGPLPVPHVAYFAHQAALGLQHASERGLVHRDIKPANLMLTSDGKARIVKILDFGLAKATRDPDVDSALTSEGQALGTPDYIAPEQILNALDVDIRADLYSLGGTMYYLLTGRPPFQATSLYEMYQAHISRLAEPIHLIRPEVPAELAALVTKLLAKDADHRFQQPAELARALSPFFKPPSSRPSPSGEVPRIEPIRTPKVTPPPLAETVRATPPPPPVVRPTPAPVRAVREPERTELGPEDPLGLLEAEPVESLIPKRRKPSAPNWIVPAAVLGGVLAAGLLVLLGIVFRYRTAEGTIVLEDVPAGAEVFVDQIRKNITVTGRGEKPVEILEVPGRHLVEVRRDGVQLWGQVVAIETGATHRLKVSFEPRETTDPRPAVETPEPGTVSLFNGKDLSGWTAWGEKGRLSAEDADQFWSVRDGILHGSGGPTYLISPGGSYRDFRVRAEVKINKGGNSGLFFHVTKPAFRPPAYVAQIDTSGVSKNSRTGSLLVDRRLANAVVPSPVPDATWFTLEVESVGNRIRIWINGKIQTDYQVSGKDPHPIGHFALESYDPATHIQYRKLELRDLGGSALKSAAKPAAFVSLFNGKDLKGWKEHPSQPGNWRVENGILVGSGTDISHLYSERADFKNIHLRFEARINEAGCGGVFIRSDYGPQRPASAPKFANGYETPIRVGTNQVKTGGLYGPDGTLSKLDVSPAPADTWAKVEMIAKGSRIIVKVNGQTTADVTDSSREAWPGRIALLQYYPQTTVQYRNIEVKDLGDADN